MAVSIATAAVHAKTGRTYYDADTLANVREKMRRYAWAREKVAALERDSAWILRMSPAECWAFVPPPEQLRAINVCIGHDCPHCGEKITRKAGHYPWIMDRNNPFKVTCPVCGRTYPDNDFQPWNTLGLKGKPETGERPVDHGLGWLGPDGRRYYFVPYYIFWQRWKRDILGGMGTLAKAYMTTDNPAYGRACAIMLTKIASEYERFDYGTQCYHEGRFQVRGRISDYIWSTGDDDRIARVYDAVWPIFDDPSLRAFLREQGIEAPRKLIEQHMLNVMARDVMSGLVAGNMGMHQRTLCTLAIVLANDDPASGPTTAAMREWLLNGPGRVEDLLWNGFWRGGLGSESSPSYSSSWCSNFYSIADLLPRIGADIWSNPKLRKMADVGIDLIIAGKFSPDIGDCGGLRGSGPIALTPELQGRAFMRYHDPRHAQALQRIGATARTLFDDLFDEKAVARAAAGLGTDFHLRTRNLGGYGLAILESGTGDHRRGLSLYYGYAGGGHGHHDRLNIEMWAYGRPMLPDDGYPFPFTRPDFWAWRSTDTVKHYDVVVDETTQLTKDAGTLHGLVSAPGLQWVDASAEVAYGSLTPLYRRTTALIDMDDRASYLFDVFRVQGGRRHDWCCHGPAFFSLRLEGGTLGPPQTRGTLAGEDVPYGTKPPPKVRNGMAFRLLDGEELPKSGAYGERSKRGWARFDKCVLTRCPAAVLTLKGKTVPPGAYTVFVHAYHYDKGTNRLRVRLGEAQCVLTDEPPGKTGYRWLSAPLTLAAPAKTLELHAEAIGQTYIQIDALALCTDANPPRFMGVTSGYHGLTHVRRMHPKGMWQACWDRPEEDLHLTVTVPGGVAGEVIVADASPEAQPGNPETIQYVLARNDAAEQGREADDGGLLSRYVATFEPHRGPAQITRVAYLRPHGMPPAPETLAVMVERGERTDLIHSAFGADVTRRCAWETPGGTLVAQAEFALLTCDRSGVRKAQLVNGTLLSYDGVELRPEPPPAGHVLAVDPARNTVTIDCPLPAPEKWRDHVVIFGNSRHSTSYTIRDVHTDGDHTTLTFGHTLFLVGMGVVRSLDEKAGTVTSTRNQTDAHRVDGGRHAGRWLYGEKQTTGFRIEDIDAATFHLRVDGDASLASVFHDENNDGRTLYWISDIGPGDTFRIPTVTTYVRP